LPPCRFGLPILYAAALLAVAWHSHFAMLSNDVFPLRWQAEHLSLRHPETFYDGFFPIGYPLLLRIAAISGNSVLATMLLQIALAVVYVLFARRFLQGVLRHEVALLALPIVLFAPQIAGNVLSVTPDFFAALFALVAFFLLTRPDIRRNIFLAGISMGVGYLFRTHIVVLALSLALALFIFENGRRMRATLSFCAGVLPFAIAQGLLQVWAGHGFFENAQAFNLWRTMYGMDWNNPAALGSASVFDVIRGNPQVFLAAYWGALRNGSLYLLPSLLALLFLFIRRRTTVQRTSQEMLLASFTFSTFLYLILTAIGGSPRNVTVVFPILVADILFIVDRVFAPMTVSKRRFVTQLFAVLLWSIGIIGIFIFSNRSVPRIRDYTEVEHLLKVHSKADAMGIYTDDFDFYFPGLRYQTPRISGGWPEVGLPHYVEEFPHLRDSSASILHDDLVNSHLHWALFRIPPYDLRGYKNVQSDTSHFRLVYRTPMHEIYRVE